MSLAMRSRYQPVVRIGNWFEDICLEQDKLRVFKELRDRGELLVEKTRKLYTNFHKEILLEAPKEYVRCGAIVQLHPHKMPICQFKSSGMQAALSVNINEEVVRQSQTINDSCELTIARSKKPCVRNSFRIVSNEKNDNKNEMLKYGQRFQLECVDNTDEPLLLYSAQKSYDLATMTKSTFNSTKYGEVNLKLGLCWKKNCGPGKEIPAAYTLWFCQHVDPGKRFETNGTVLPSNKPLVITHAATNRNLAAENVIIQTLFGPEFLVSVQNYKNIHKREIWKNIWIIGNGNKAQ